jgi:Uma2 family endonuclease
MSVAMEDWPRRHRITVDEYHRMGESGALARDARVELIDGVIIDMPPIGSLHAAVGRRLDSLLREVVGSQAIVSCQWPLQLGDDSEPQPDIALVRPRENFYEDRHPTEADTLLVVEISVTMLDDDLRRKSHLYARHRVPEYWVVDAVDQRLHLFRRPGDSGYAQAWSLDRPHNVDIGALPGLSVDLSRIFG